MDNFPNGLYVFHLRSFVGDKMKLYLVTLPEHRTILDETTMETWVHTYFNVLPFDHETLLERLRELPVSSQHTTASVTFRCIGENNNEQ